MTLINSVGYFSYLLFNFSVVFIKLRNSSVIKVFVSYCLSWVKGRLDPFSNGFLILNFFGLMDKIRYSL